MYEVEIKKNCLKFISKLDLKRRQKLEEFILKFKENHKQFPYKKLVNRDNEYRIRFQEFRISYYKDKDKLIITIIKIGFRENFYNK